MRRIDCVQGSGEWLKARAGKITASRLADVLDYLKSGKESQKRADYRLDLLAERLTGQAEDCFVSSEMRWGNEWEPIARGVYETRNDVLVDQAGFIVHPSMDFSGASPDSLVDANGGLEIKCPKTTTHLEWMMAGVVPAKHKPQCLWNMVCAEREWWDFASYDPRLPEGLRMFQARMYRDEEEIKAVEREVVKFNAEIEAMICTLCGVDPKQILKEQLEASLA